MIHLRTCLFHPKELATCWSGHVHLQPLNDIHIIVGLCKLCQKAEIDCGEGNCEGCFGIIEGSR